jgi:hypothetical protein
MIIVTPSKLKLFSFRAISFAAAHINYFYN